MPVTILDAWTGTNDFPTDGLNLSPSAGSNRVGWVFASHEMNGGGGMSMGTVTWGDQTVTEVHDFVVGSTTAYHNLNYVGYITEAQIAAMSGSALSFTFTNGNGGVGPFGNAKTYAATYQDVDQADIVSASNSATNTSTASLAPGAIDVDVDQKVIAFVVAGQPNAVAPGTGYTEESAFTGPSNDHASGAMHRTATTNDDTHNVAHTCSSSTRMAVSNVCMGFDAGGPTEVTLTGTMIGSAAFQIEARKTIAATAIAVPAFDRQLSLSQALTATMTGVPAFQRQVGKGLVGTVIGVADLAAQKMINVAMAAVMTAVLALQKRANITLASTALVVPAFQRHMTKTLTATVTAASAIAKQVNKALAAVMTGVAALSALTVANISMAATMVGVPDISIRRGITLAATVVGVPVLKIRAQKTLAAVVVPIATFQLRVGKILRSTMTAVVTLAADTGNQRVLAATAEAVVAIQMHITKTLTATADVVPTIKQLVSKTLRTTAALVAGMTAIEPSDAVEAARRIMYKGLAGARGMMRGIGKRR